MTEQQTSYRQIMKATSLYGGVQVFNIIISIIHSIRFNSMPREKLEIPRYSISQLASLHCPICSAQQCILKILSQSLCIGAIPCLLQCPMMTASWPFFTTIAMNPTRCLIPGLSEMIFKPSLKIQLLMQRIITFTCSFDTQNCLFIRLTRYFQSTNLNRTNCPLDTLV